MTPQQQRLAAAGLYTSKAKKINLEMEDDDDESDDEVWKADLPLTLLLSN